MKKFVFSVIIYVGFMAWFKGFLFLVFVVVQVVQFFVDGYMVDVSIKGGVDFDFVVFFLKLEEDFLCQVFSGVGIRYKMVD